MESSRTCRGLRSSLPRSTCLLPRHTALFVALVEFVGGILFALGLGSRLVSLVLFVNMTVAYLSVPDDRVNFSHILSNPSDFYNATPYTYWFAALIILVFGPGWIALDTVLRRAFERSTMQARPVHAITAKRPEHFAPASLFASEFSE